MAGKVPYFYLTVKSKLNLKEKIFSSLLGGSFGFLIGFSAVGAAAFTDFEEVWVCTHRFKENIILHTSKLDEIEFFIKKSLNFQFSLRGWGKFLPSAGPVIVQLPQLPGNCGFLKEGTLVRF